MATGDYCTLADLKAKPNLNIPDTVDDTLLVAVIAAVSRRIDQHCGRWFFPMGTAEAPKTFYYTAEEPDRLKTNDILSLTEFAIDIAGYRQYSIALDPSWDYDLQPYNAPNDPEPSPYTWIERAPYGRYAFPIGERAHGLYRTGIRKGCRLKGVFGWSTTPAAVASACLLQCERLFKRGQAPFGVLGSAEMGQQIVIPKLDPDVMFLLQPYVRFGIGAV